MAVGRRRNCGVVILVVIGALSSILASCSSSEATTTPPSVAATQGQASSSATGPTTTGSAPAAAGTTPPAAALDTATAAGDPGPSTDASTTSASGSILPAATFSPRVPPILVTCTGAYRTNDTLPLSPCQKGSVVADIQKALVGFGYDITADGLYGQATADAVQSFQYVMNLPQTGVVDEATFTALGIDSEVDF